MAFFSKNEWPNGWERIKFQQKSDCKEAGGGEGGGAELEMWEMGELGEMREGR